jgi:hypothetical protein
VWARTDLMGNISRGGCGFKPRCLEVVCASAWGVLVFAIIEHPCPSSLHFNPTAQRTYRLRLGSDWSLEGCTSWSIRCQASRPFASLCRCPRNGYLGRSDPSPRLEIGVPPSATHMLVSHMRWALGAQPPRGPRSHTVPSLLHARRYNILSVSKRCIAGRGARMP